VLTYADGGFAYTFAVPLSEAVRGGQ